MLTLQSQKSRSKNPMSEYLLKLQLIVSNAEFKNMEEARKYETMETKLEGEKYCRAKNGTDIFESYEYDGRMVYSVLLDLGFTSDVAYKMIQNQQIIPQPVKEKLKEFQRKVFIAKYSEPNPYYVMLTGVPFPGSVSYPADPIVTIPDEFYQAYRSDGAITEGMAVHEMPTKYQDLLMNSPYYAKLLEDNPEARYLKYIGSKSIPIETSRMAKDGELMKIDLNHLTTNHGVFGTVTVEPDIIHLFTNVYGETRRYVYDTLRGDFTDIYPNYNDFIRFLTIYMAIGGCMNELMRKSVSMIHMNTSTANDFFMLYGLPSVIMEGPSMMSFLKQFRLILMDKGTNVVYRVKDLVGYDYTDIYTLVMVKQQVFDDAGNPMYKDGKPVQNIVFRRLGTTDDNTSYFKYKDAKETYTLEEITSGDPRWWNTPEVEQMLNDMNYTLSNSKYIQLSTHMSMSDIYWQCIILIRGLLDNRFETQYTNLNIGMMLKDDNKVSVFEAVLILEILMNWHINTVANRTLRGDMYLMDTRIDGVGVCLDLFFDGLNKDGTPKPLVIGPPIDPDNPEDSPRVPHPFKISSFNFNLKRLNPEFYASIQEMDYLEPDVLIPMLDDVMDREDLNIGEIIMTKCKAIYDYLVLKLRDTRTIQQFRQVTDVFKELFLVDPIRNSWYVDGNATMNIQEYLMDEYNVSAYDLNVLHDLTKGPEGNISFPYSIDSEIYDPETEKVTVNVGKILSYNGYEEFSDPKFVAAFEKALDAWTFNFTGQIVSRNIKVNYKNIIRDTVELESGNDIAGPKTFEVLLFREDPEMYRYLRSLKDNGDSILIAIRSIIKALEQYTQSTLHALEFSALGQEDYFKILKEVISYFKSYMVEFTKDEFVFIFDGFFDQGGSPNMLKLHDENTKIKLKMGIQESLTLHDASHAKVHEHYADRGLMNMYDEMLVRHRTTYQRIKQFGYPIKFDIGSRISYDEPRPIANDERLIFSIYEKKINGSTVREITIFLDD